MFLFLYLSMTTYRSTSYRLGKEVPKQSKDLTESSVRSRYHPPSPLTKKRSDYEVEVLEGKRSVKKVEGPLPIHLVSLFWVPCNTGGTYRTLDPNGRTSKPSIPLSSVGV